MITALWNLLKGLLLLLAILIVFCFIYVIVVALIKYDRGNQ